MDDPQLSRLLSELPRDEASPYFTAGVLSRIRQRRPVPRAGLWRLALATTFAAALLVSGLGLREFRDQHRHWKERQEAIARLESLEARKQRLEDEIRTLQRLARDAQPVVYLGSTSNLDVVVDLRRLADRQPQFVNHSRR